jgi:hypothetical protein
MVGLALAVAVAGCAPRMASVALPDGTGTPLESAAVQAAAAAMAAPCHGLQALTADLRIAGRVDGEKVRGTLQVGVDASAIRIEGVPPFGAPVFVLAGQAEAATLLLVRERAYVDNAPVTALTDALVGVALSPSDLLTLLAGCGVSTDAPLHGVGFGAEWVRLDLPDGVRAWLSTAGSGNAPTLRVVETAAWRVDYEAQPTGQAVRGTLRRVGAGGTTLTFTVEAPERLAALPTGALEVTIPREARRVSLDDLRRQRTLVEP